MHAKASVDGTIIAETDHYEFVEGNVYFPPDSVKNMSEFLIPSSHTSSCPWKGMGHYYDINVPGKTLENAAWYYPEPFEKAEFMKNYVAFCKSLTMCLCCLRIFANEW